MNLSECQVVEDIEVYELVIISSSYRVWGRINWIKFEDSHLGVKVFSKTTITELIQKMIKDMKDLTEPW